MQHRSVQVVEAYDGYEPPISVSKCVVRYLRTVPQQHLVGLESVVLTNSSAASKSTRKRLKRTETAAHSVGGYYHRRSSTGNAYIELFVDNVMRGVPRAVMIVPFTRDLHIAPKLFHEIGHHVTSILGSDRHKEQSAEEWKKKLLARYVRRVYWYLLPFLWVAARLRRIRRTKNGEGRSASR